MKIIVPSVFVFSHDARHRGELKAALSPYYEVSVFEEAGPAIAALDNADPDVIIAEHDVPPADGIGQLIARASDDAHKAGFLLTRRKDEDFRVSLEQTGRPGRYLTWPFTRVP